LGRPCGCRLGLSVQVECSSDSEGLPDQEGEFVEGQKVTITVE
jgi:hypothetical protein